MFFVHDIANEPSPTTTSLDGSLGAKLPKHHHHHRQTSQSLESSKEDLESWFRSCSEHKGTCEQGRCYRSLLQGPFHGQEGENL